MRFPWLQVDADFIGAKASDLGAHLGISRREAMGLALDLWTWALARARDDAPPDGLVTGTGPVPDRLLSGSVQWTGPAEVFTEALVAVGLAVRVDGGYRLTGFDRYKSTWEKNRRRHGAKPERNRTGTGEEPDRKTQTQTQTHREEKSPPTPQGEGDTSKPKEVGKTPTPARQPASARDVRGNLPFEAGGGVTGEPLRDAVDAEHRKRTGRAYPWLSEDQGACVRLLDLCVAEGLEAEAAVPEIARRFGHALQRAGDRYAPHAERANTLTELARRTCWAANAKPPQAPKQTGYTGPAMSSLDAFDRDIPGGSTP